jgi:hypothetical protein
VGAALMATIAELVRQGQCAGRGEDPGLPSRPTTPATAGGGGASPDRTWADTAKTLAPWMLLPLAMAFSSRVPGARVSAYRDWLAKMSREAAPHTPVPKAEWVRRMFSGPWWHGSDEPYQILERGFVPEKVGKNFPQKFGEPFGVSLSASPFTAKSFITGTVERPILRVWPNVDPTAALPVWSPEAAGPLHRAYLDALNEKVPHIGGTVGHRLDMRATSMPGKANPQWFLEEVIRQLRNAEPQTVDVFNRAISGSLGKQGVQALLMNPNRYNEYELRILDLARAIPMEARELGVAGQGGKLPLSAHHPPASSEWEWALPHRFRGALTSGKAALLDQYRKALPQTSSEGVLKLGDIYKQIDPQRILRGTKLPTSPLPNQAPTAVEALASPEGKAWMKEQLAKLAAEPAPTALPKGVLNKGWIKVGGKTWVKLDPAHANVIANTVNDIHTEMPATSKIKPGSIQFWDAVWARLVTTGNKDAAKWLAQHLVK